GIGKQICSQCLEIFFHLSQISEIHHAKDEVILNFACADEYSAPRVKKNAIATLIDIVVMR
ncbi:MAG: hypothetical protein RIS79_3194, partial [Verrucomicrobiota bacterium]